MNFSQSVSLEEVIEWGLLVALGLGVLLVAARGIKVVLARQTLRKQRRHCVQCGLLEESKEGRVKFGICQVCGGVTTRGRSRKLG